MLKVKVTVAIHLFRKKIFIILHLLIDLNKLHTSVGYYDILSVQLQGPGLMVKVTGYF